MNDPRLQPDLPVPSGLVYPHAEEAMLAIRTGLALVIRKCGPPVILFLLRFIPRVSRNDVLKLLHPVELVLRRLIVFEALSLARRLTGLPKLRGRTKLGKTPAREPNLRDSTRWRVSLKIIPRPTPPDPAAPKPSRPAGPRPNSDSRPLAFRLEAAIRLAIDPLACIRRLARRFHRSAPGAELTPVLAERHVGWDELNFHLCLLPALTGLLLEQPDTS